jgi:hypothetical protein
MSIPKGLPLFKQTITTLNTYPALLTITMARNKEMNIVFGAMSFGKPSNVPTEKILLTSPYI